MIDAQPAITPTYPSYTTNLPITPTYAPLVSQNVENVIPKLLVYDVKLTLFGYTLSDLTNNPIKEKELINYITTQFASSLAIDPKCIVVTFASTRRALLGGSVFAIVTITFPQGFSDAQAQTNMAILNSNISTVLESNAMAALGITGYSMSVNGQVPTNVYFVKTKDDRLTTFQIKMIIMASILGTFAFITAIFIGVLCFRKRYSRVAPRMKLPDCP
jgi:hypothetical protein